MTRFDADRALSSSHQMWEEDILPELERYIRIPNVSPAYDPNWEWAGHMNRAVELLSGWALRQPIPGLAVEVIRLPGRTPLIFMEIPGTAPGTVVLYGHLDKQPPMEGKWRAGLHPWTPVRDGDKLFGRGGADDGYSTFAAAGALRLLAQQNVPHARCVVLIEADEESGSDDLPFYVEHLAERIGTPDLIVCLDSECGDYEHLWTSTSLRGLINGTLEVQILRQEVHSGKGTGPVPSTFRIAQILLSRVEDTGTGEILLPALRTDIPLERRRQAQATAEALGSRVHAEFPWIPGALPAHHDPLALILAQTWEPGLEVIGADGMPDLKGGNVFRPSLTLNLSMRLPPLVDPNKAAQVMKIVLEENPPYGARVTFTPGAAAAGWNAPPVSPWLEESISEASRACFGKPALAMGVGGSIPFMGMLGEEFPEAQFLITGLLGPGSNAHAPDECLHIPTGKRLTAAVAKVIADHAARR